MQVNITATEGTSVTLRLQKTDSEITAADLVDSDLPVHFSLGVPERATATLYPQGGTGNSATTSEEKPGTLTVYSLEPDLQACFSFQATDSEETSYNVGNGAFSASLLEL